MEVNFELNGYTIGMIVCLLIAVVFLIVGIVKLCRKGNSWYCNEKVLGLLHIICTVFFVVIAICFYTEGKNETKLDYAINNNYSFYLNGDDVTDKLEDMDLDSYSISFDKYDEKKIIMSTTR